MQSKRYATLFMCLIIVALVSTALSSLQVRRCVLNKSYNDGCNDCTCFDGRRSCTMKVCTVWDESLKKNVPAPVKDAPSDFWEPISKVPVPKA